MPNIAEIKREKKNNNFNARHELRFLLSVIVLQNKSLFCCFLLKKDYRKEMLTENMVKIVSYNSKLLRVL